MSGYEEDGSYRKLRFIDAKKAHLNPKCDDDVYIQLPPEVKTGQGMCGKLVHWLYGLRPAAAAWERYYADKFEEKGFQRGLTCGVVFYHPQMDVSMAVHGDDFTFCGLEQYLWTVKRWMDEWFEVKVRGRLGPERHDDKCISVLGRLLRWEDWGITYQADPKHRNIILEQLGLEQKSKGLMVSGKVEEPEEFDEALQGARGLIEFQWNMPSAQQKGDKWAFQWGARVSNSEGP